MQSVSGNRHGGVAGKETGELLGIFPRPRVTSCSYQRGREYRPAEDPRSQGDHTTPSVGISLPSLKGECLYHRKARHQLIDNKS